MPWITLADVEAALTSGRLWLLSGPNPTNRRIAIADTEEEARAQFPVVDDSWECKLANPKDWGV